MSTKETARTLKWRNIPSSGLSRVWIKNRPEDSLSGRQPYTLDLLVLRVESCTTGGATGPLWFFPFTNKDLAQSDTNINKTRISILDKGVAPAGFCSPDILRAMDAINGVGKRSTVNSLGWLALCNAPKGLRKLNTSFPSDYVANAANVIALCRVAVKAVRS